MANKILWDAVAASRGTVLTTELNSLGNGAYSGLGTEIDNTTNLDQYAAVHIHLASLNPTTGAYLQLFLVQELAASYEDAPSSTNPGYHMSVAVMSVTTGSATKEVASPWFRIPPGKFKFVLLNASGVALGATLNTHLGLSALPNAAAGANLGLPLGDANGRVDVIKVAGTTQTARDIGASVLVGDKTGFSLSAAGVQAIWDALTAALTTANSIGKLFVDNLNATISSRLASASVPANFASMSITAGGLVDITQAAADKVWGTAARTLTAFSTGLAVSVWDVLEASSAVANSFGVKLKKFSFNASSEVAANTESINNTAVLGVGSAIDKWRG